MSEPRSTRKPTFAWQATLILLPVVVLATFGLLAIRRDYNAVEQEAQRRAEGIARDLASRLASPVALERYLKRAGAAAGPEPSDLWAAYARQLAERRAADPGQTLSEALHTPVKVSASGELIWPLDYPVAPTPAAWLSELTAGQERLWQAAKAAEGAQRSGDEIREVFQAFLESGPSVAARANADLALRTLSLEANPVENGLVEFARRHDEVPSESGLPLAAVALARAIHKAEGTGLNVTLFEELARQMSAGPCLLTPQLLDTADHLAPGSPVHAKQAVEALRDRWAHEERLRSLTHRAYSLAPTLGLSPTNFWFNWDSQRWLVLVKPVVARTKDVGPQESLGSRHEGAPPEHQNPTVEIRFLPKVAIQWVARQDLAQAGVFIPDYFTVGLVLDGEPLGMTAATDSRRASNRDSVVDEATNRIRRILARSTSPSRAEAPPMPEGPAPTRPTDPDVVSNRLEIAIELGDPPRLYAEARQRALLFGGLILAAAVTSLVGLVTARRAFARQLRLNELKSNFVSSVSHELRAPIASVRLLAESLERGKVVEPARQAEYFKLIVQECRRLGALIANVLDFSRIDQGRKQYEFEPTDLTALVHQTLQLMEPYAAERQVRLLISPTPSPLAPHPSSLNLDGRAIQQALLNLLDNALKHAPAGTTVTVGLETGGRTSEVGSRTPEGGRREVDDGVHRSRITDPSPLAPRPSPLATLWVEDSGPGIPPDEHEQIFEPFYRRGTELRRETPGVGIGLTIVQHIVEAHGGRVTVRSAVGQGSRFTIELPANPNATGPDPVEPGPNHEAH
jgi:signal transduction histidine kinase